MSRSICKWWWALGVCLLASAALAQDRNAGAKIRLPIPIPNPLNIGATNSTIATSNSEDQIAAALSKPFQDIANFINSDLDGAIALSTAIPTLQDGNGQQCWMAMKQFGAIVKAHPMPLTGHAVTDLQAARLMAMAANNLCSNQNCTQVFADLASAVQKVNASASIIPAAGALQIPSLNSLCTNVPTVPVVPPVSVPAPANATPATVPAK